LTLTLETLLQHLAFHRDFRIAKTKEDQNQNPEKREKLQISLLFSDLQSPISINGGLDFSRASKDCIVKALSLRDSSIPCRSTLSSLSRSYNQTFLLCKL
ncbi:hypothetical protein GIB67_033583, partial [Kingdonia uniflora]